MEERKSQPASAARPEAEIPRLGRILATLMSERGFGRNETARLCDVQPQTIKNTLDGKSVNARFVMRLIDIFELRDRPEMLRCVLISHLALQLGDNWIEILKRAHLIEQPATRHQFSPQLAPCETELTATLPKVMDALHVQPFDLALQCNVSPRIVRECLRGKNISAKLVRGLSAVLREDTNLLRRVLLSYMAQQYGTESIALMTAARLFGDKPDEAPIPPQSHHQ